MESKHGQLVAALNGAVRRARVACAGLASAAFPHFCVVCGREGHVLCAACRPHAISPTRGIFVCPGCGSATPLGARCGRCACASSSGIDGLITAAPYAHPVFRELLRLHKYERVAEAGETVRAAYSGFARDHAAAFRAVSGGAIVVPVPMHPVREALRGFNQAEGFARVAAAVTGKPCVPGLLRRRFRFRAQANLSAGRRSANAAGSVVVSGYVQKGAAFMLVDDVVTTGATLDACAAALKSAGAGTVWASTFLRG